MPVDGAGRAGAGRSHPGGQLEHPAPYLLQMMTHTSTYPPAAPCGGGQGPGLGATGQSMSATAPSLLKEWVPNGHVTVVKNPRFYDAANVALERVILLSDRRLWRGPAAHARRRTGFPGSRLPAQQIDWIRAQHAANPSPGAAADRRISRGQSSPASPSTTSACATPSTWRSTAKPSANASARSATCRPTIWCRPAPRIFPAAMALHFQDHALSAQRMERSARPDARGRLWPRQAAAHHLHDPQPPRRATTAPWRRPCSRCWRRSISTSPSCPTTCMVFLRHHPCTQFRHGQSGLAGGFQRCRHFSGTVHHRRRQQLRANTAIRRSTRCWRRPRTIPIWSAAGKSWRPPKPSLLQGSGHHAALFLDQSESDPALCARAWQANAIDYHRSRWVTIDERARAKLFA